MRNPLSKLVLGAAITAATSTAYAIDLTIDALSPGSSAIPPAPLELGVSPPPMVLLMLDDSLSMSANLLTDDTESGGNLAMAGLEYRWTFPLPPEAPGDDGDYTDAHLHRLAAPRLALVEYWNNGLIPSRVGRSFFGGRDLHPDYDNSWKAYSAEFNAQYYDPNVVYEPWAYGVDVDGNEFVDANPSAARLNPYDPAGGTIDLTARHTVELPVFQVDGTQESAVHGLSATCILDTGNCDFRIYVPHYYVAVDSDFDDDIDGDDEPQYIEITDAAELQNFANWFQYHRSRLHSVKAALANFMSEVGEVYMGTATINHTSVGQLEVALLNGDETTGHRRAVMDAIFGTRGVAAGSPLREALDDAKRYFACGGTNLYGNTNCPRLVDPSAGSCQQASTILITDGFNSADGSTRRSTGSPGAHGAAGSNYVVSNTPTGNAAGNADGNEDTAFDGGAYADSFSGSLGDVAMDAYERDLDGSYAARQFMSTYVLHLGVSGTVVTPAATDDPFAWPNPTHGAGDFAQVNLIDDLTHAAFNGRGQICTVGDPNIADKFSATQALRSGNTQGTASIGIETGAILRDQQVFLASYDGDDLSGDLEAFGLEIDGSLGDRNWSAADRLDTDLAGTGWQDRLVLTYNHSGRTGMRFTYQDLCDARTDQLTQLGLPEDIITVLDELATAAEGVRQIVEALEALGNLPLVGDLISDLRDNYLDPLLAQFGYSYTELITEQTTVICSGGIDAALLLGLSRNLSEAQVDYIRGDTSEEAPTGAFRARNTQLGPIYRSRPVFVGAPRQDYPESLEAGSYSEFRAANANRRGMVYVGANDGMLHGFDAETGQELLAYVPGQILGKLSALTEPGYTAQAFVDGRISVVDAYDEFPACGTGNCWRTILVGGLRGGGQAYFALDVTDPDSFVTANTPTEQSDLAEEIVLWEFTDSPSGVGLTGIQNNAKFFVQGILTDGLFDVLETTTFPENIDDIALESIRQICRDTIFLLPVLCESALLDIVVGAIPLGAVAGPINNLLDLAVPLTIPVLDPLSDQISDVLDVLIPTGEQFGHPDMGYSFGRPNIVRAQDGSWRAVFGNGFHATEVDIGLAEESDPSLLGLGVSVTGNSVIYAVDLATGGINAPGTRGVFDSGVGNWIPPLTEFNDTNLPIELPDPDTEDEAGDFSPEEDGRANGMADVAPADLDGDFVVDRAYAGDERGNMWRLDIDDADSSNWEFAFSLVGEPRPLFDASTNANRLQSITTRPEVGLHPINDYLVLFGTGKFHEIEDLGSSGLPDQSFYAIWDKYDPGTQPTITRSDLLEQTIDDERTIRADLDQDGDDEQRTLRVTSDDPVNYRNALNTGAGTHLGWYIDLVVDGASSNNGERIFGDPILRNGQITFATVLPADSQCAFEGFSFVYRLESASGGRPFIPPIDQTIDGIFANGIKSEAISAAPVVLLTEDGKEVTLQRSEDGSTSAVITKPGGFERQRATWRELR